MLSNLGGTVFRLLFMGLRGPSGCTSAQQELSRWGHCGYAVQSSNPGIAQLHSKGCCCAGL